MSKTIVFTAIGIIGILLAIGGALVLGLFPKLLESKIKEGLRLINGSHAFERWRNAAPVPISMKFYIMELNNSDSYTNLNDIQLRERGPYVFDEIRTKEEILFYENDKNQSLVSYRERRHYEFKEDLSVGQYDDNITFINLPVLGVIFNEILTDGKFGFELFKDKLEKNDKSLFTTRTVGELLFDGINTTLYKQLEPFLPKNSGMSLAPFSLIPGRNALEREWTIFTGIDSLDNFGHIYRFNHKLELRNDDKKNTSIWPYHQDPDQSCNDLTGTDGSFFGPYLNQNDMLYVFEPQLCRSLFLKYKEPSEVRGIRTLRYYSPKEEFESPLKFKQNSCYCLKKNITDCAMSGALKISHCLLVSKGAPVVVSAPYFLNGDQSLRDDINLKSPKKLNFENYGTFLDIEPMTGTVLRAIKRLQINIQISHSDAIPELNATKAGKDYIIPALWIEESAELDEKSAQMLKTMIFDKQKLITGASISAILVGAFLTLITVYLIAKSSK